MKISRERKVKNEPTTQEALDPVQSILQDGTANVSVTMGYSFPFGEGKCSVSVSLSCQQTEGHVDTAFRLASELANKYAKEGMELVVREIQSGLTRDLLNQ